MQVPTALWISILVAATSIVNQYYGDLWWTPVVLAIFVAAGKWIEVNVVDPPPAPQSDFGGPAPDQPSKFKRWLVGP